MKTLQALSAALIVVTASAPALAAAPANEPAVSRLSVRDSTAVVNALIDVIRKTYVFPDKREAIATRLKSVAPKFDATAPDAFAKEVDAELATFGDRHLAFEYAPSEYAEKVAQRDHADYSGISDRIRRGNHGYVSQQVLAGNVRYLKLANFRWIPGESEPVADAAIRFLKGGDAIILDLRGNSGGDPRAVRYLISTFTDREIELAGEFDGSTGVYTPMRTIAEPPAGRVIGKPLWVLIDRTTFSAGEEFAYEVQQYKLGTLVGEKTAGGANGSKRHPIAPFFIASVPDSRLVHPLTGTNWEGVGVSPDVACAGREALDRALLAALTTLQGARPAGGRSALDWSIAAVRGRIDPYRPTDADLGSAGGAYGIRKLSVEDGRLVYRREGGAPVVLRPLSKDTFQFGDDETLRVRLTRNGDAVTGLEIFDEEGLVARSERTGP